MNPYKPKHITLPEEMHDRMTAITNKLGCTFSKLIQIALDERLPQWEAEIGSFEIDHRKTFEEKVMEKLKAHGPGKPLAQLIGTTAPPVAQD